MSASNNRRKERRRMLRAAGIPTNLNLTGSAEIDLTAAKEGEPARRPTFAMQAYTGGAINVGWGKPVIIDLAGLRAAEPIAILLDHDRTKIIGQSTKVEIAGGVVSVTGMITGGDSDPNVSQVVTHARNGFRWPVSVGVAVGKTEAVGENKTVTVNGKEFAGPAYVIRAGVLRETSFVGIGADEHASASVAASATTTPKGAQDMEFTQWLMAKYALDAEMLTAEQTVKFKAEFAGQSKPEVKPTQTPDLDAQIEERRRVSAINAKAADLGQNCNVDTLERLRDIAAQCIEAKLGVKDAELRMLRERRPDPTGPAIHTSKAPDAKVLAAAMLLNCGVSDETLAKDRDFGPGVVDAAWKHRRLSIHGLLAAGLQADGVHAPHDGQGLFNAVVEHGIRAGFSTVNLPGILGTVGNKLLLDAFTSVATTYQTIAQQSDFSNFLTYTQYRLDQTGAFAQVGTDGEIKHGKLAESSYTNKLETSGLMLTLTRQQIINDDVNALQALYGTLGKSAVIAVEEALYGQVMESGDVFYTSGQGNIITSNPLSVDGLAAAEAALMKMKDANNKPIYARGKYILVPPELLYQARSLYTSENVNETTTANKAKPATNVYRGMFEVVSSPFMSMTSMTGYSASGWYMLADPKQLPAFQVAYLNGQRTPTIQTADAAFNTLGLQMRCIFDFGVAQVDYRGAISNDA